LTQQAIDAVGLGTKPLSVTFGQGRSDYQPFWGKHVPVVFFTDATNACYHTSADEIDIVDFAKLSRQSEIGFRLVVALSESEPRPNYVSLASLDTYEDLVVLSEFLTRALADLDVVDPAYQGQLLSLEQEARARVAAGPDGFGPTDALTIAQDALTITTRGIPCDPMLLPEPDTRGAASIAILALGAAIARCRRPWGR
jgi:hypothetical protein